MTLIFSSNEPKHIVEDFAVGLVIEENLDKSRKDYDQQLNQIRTIYGTIDKNNTILKYGVAEMKENLELERKKSKSFDWDSFTYKDDNGELIELICERIKSLNPQKKQELEGMIMKKIEDNICKYFEKDFDEKVEEAKNDFQLYGVNDYYLEV